jgi:3-methyladenine DNA glycosylase Mpg
MDLLSGGDIRLFKPLNSNMEIGNSKRIGIDYAGAAANWPLRFFDRNSNSLSGPTRLNRKP